MPRETARRRRAERLLAEPRPAPRTLATTDRSHRHHRLRTALVHPNADAHPRNDAGGRAERLHDRSARAAERRPDRAGHAGPARRDRDAAGGCCDLTVLRPWYAGLHTRPVRPEIARVRQLSGAVADRHREDLDAPAAEPTRRRGLPGRTRMPPVHTRP